MTILTPGQGQSLLALLSGIGGQSAGGLMGLFELARTGNAGKASARVQKTAEKLAYTPDDPQAIAMLQGAGNALGPVADALDAAGTWAGENTASATGSPLLGSLAKLAPDVIPLDRIVSVLARAAKGASPVLARMAADGGMPSAEGIEVGVPNRREMAQVRAASAKNLEADYEAARQAWIKARDVERDLREHWETTQGRGPIGLFEYPQEVEDAAFVTNQAYQRAMQADEALRRGFPTDPVGTPALPPAPDLDLSEAARTARRDAEYTPVYHGTGEGRDVGAFSLRQAGSRSGGNSARLGIWSAETPNTSNAYAFHRARDIPRSEGQKFYEAIEEGSETELDIPGNVAEYIDIPGVSESLGATGGVSMPLYLRKGKTFVHDFGDEGARYGGGLLSKIIEKAWGDGYDTVEFRNIIDDPASELSQQLSPMEGLQDAAMQSTHYVARDPSQYRTPWADYDPELKHLPDLNALKGRQPNIMAALQGDARSAALNSIFSYLLAQRER
jgi:hypothetical protein